MCGNLSNNSSPLHRYNLRIHITHAHQLLKMGIPNFFFNFDVHDNLEHSGDTILSRRENVTISQYTLGL